MKEKMNFILLSRKSGLSVQVCFKIYIWQNISEIYKFINFEIKHEKVCEKKPRKLYDNSS